ncbi:MAG: DEAD/DEAH box helicase [Mesorhizobium sp.]|nr:MAG: DEAD/DEAH box helicase [Mesorhizobium sp.]RWO76069.1 MAG: DEAD/DEAH box helicase [Mesorhizobium sp.]
MRWAALSWALKQQERISLVELDGHDAFKALARLLECADDGTAWRAKSPSVERLRIALTELPQHASALDLAVLLRQAINHERTRRGTAVPVIPVSHARCSDFRHWNKVGIEARLIFEMPDMGGDVRIRSRFAEMMRLLAANRQLFPNRPWQGAPSLVADFRVDRRPRRFPRRDRAPNVILQDNPNIIGTSPLRRDLWQSLTARSSLRFSAFQERAAVRLSSATDDGGTIVTAGTGSGKTIAFYLPGMIRIGEAIDANYWVKAIAIYPRIELLKDQFAEAFRMAREIDAPLRAHGRRALMIGAVFGATPRRASRQELSDRNWQRRGQDFVCPWMRCPSCDAELFWRGSDIDSGTEQLVCAEPGCQGHVSEDQIVLTRGRLQRHPPDILFTTTEILNQRLSDQWMRGLFGVGLPAGRKPMLALLDEVHTYAGATGAQAALTLRRWRHLLGAPIGWVGLSATLGDAARFFADLTGAHPDRVVEITPTVEEYAEEGAEYQILLRGDPGSRTSLLSTTIQTAMLLPRLLDPPGATDTSGSFGRRAFLFTDDLDVTNRLYDDLRDAEAYTIFGRPDAQRLPLANIRRAGPDAAVRDVEGQRWRICEDIGHPLDRRLIVGRTTSQDAGVNQAANIVVATAALEVGFNDPLVGAVIQHKAPRGMASFLQRKGRAGRGRAMRPITLTVLSDYGRDRAFYQAFEHLFDPTLEPQHLPIRNPYVLKIQAVFALFDWLAANTGGYEKAWQWDILSRPHPQPSSAVRAVIDLTRTKLTQLVQGDPATIESLRIYLASALGVSRDVVDTLLWEAPRSLLLEAVPTLVRRLFRNWELAFPTAVGSLDLQDNFHPLPDFVPRSLFSDLSLPEVRVIIPPASVNHEERIEAMPILQALNQFVPGRVTRRFAHERGALSHWIPVDPAFPEQQRRIGDYAESHEYVGTFSGSLNDHTGGPPLLVFRPWAVRLERAARSDALPSSNARLVWHSDIMANGDPLTIPVPLRSEWRRYVRTIDFHLHRFRSSVSVRRFAPMAHANVRTLQDDFPITLHFTSDDDRAAAIGFALEVDGFRLDLALPEPHALAASILPPNLIATSTLAYLRDTFLSDSELPNDLNSFQREWLFQFLVSVVMADAAVNDRAIAASIADLLDDDRITGVFRGVMEETFGAIPPITPDDDDADDADAEDEDDATAIDISAGPARAARGPGRLQQGLLLQLGRPIVRERLRAIAAQLQSVNAEAFNVWLRRLVLETLGEAMLQACIAAAPRQATVDTLLVDVRDDVQGGIASVWITESTLGGAGVLEAFAERFAAEPRLFFTALEAALAPTDLELVDDGLREIVALGLANQDVGDQIARLRSTNSHGEREALWQSLSHRLAQRGGIDLSHALSVSLNNRLLRTGSGPQLDRLLLDLQAHWDALESRFGLAIELRELAYICSKDVTLSAAIRAYLSATLPPGAIGHVTVLAAITSLLWPRANEVRKRVLQSHNPFRRTRSTDPAIVRHLMLSRSIATIELSDPDWQAALNATFDAQGSVRLAADASDAPALRRALVRLVVTPVSIGVLQFFPTVERVERSHSRILVSLTLREQV